jgi:hypothetical protein
VHPLPNNKKSYQVPSHSDVDNIIYKKLISQLTLKDNTTNKTSQINFWDTNIVYDTIFYTKLVCEDKEAINLISETTAKEVRLSDKYFFYINMHLFVFSTLFSENRKDMAIDSIKSAFGIGMYWL